MSIHQAMRRKGFENCKLDAEEGFYIEGKNLEDCINQLREWCNARPEKWVYYHNCGMAPSKPISIARNILEVLFYDMQPARPPIPTVCFQQGVGDKREIDTMSEDEVAELRKKQMFFFYMLGNGFRKGGER